MINIRDKKVAVPLGIIALIIIIKLIMSLFTKTDDWAYTYISSTKWLIYAGIVAALAVLSWLIISIYLIIKGTPNELGKNPKRKLGLWLLIAPFVLAGLAFLSVLSGLYIPLIIIPVLAVALLIYGIAFSIKKHVKIALIPLIVIPILVIGSFGSLLLIGGSRSVGSANYLMAAGSASIGSSLSKSMDSESLGFSVGGAKDINNFRENIENNYLPLPSDITYEGLYYDYFFDTGETNICEKLFCPSYSYSLSKDPLSSEEEYYLQVGLNSNMKESDFQRKKLNLVVVLDISGSMGSSFNSYYYDRFGNFELSEKEKEDMQKTKMKIASEAVVDLLGNLHKDDRFGMVLFDNSDYLGKPLSYVGETDMGAIKSHILELEPKGGTNFEAGYKGGTKLFNKYLDADPEEYENRIIFLTDAMPNIGSIREEGLLGMTKENAENNIHTTFIGIGVDFNTELIEAITKVRGANYYSVHSAKEFKTRMDDEFEYMVTPLVFNLLLTLDAPGFEIEKVYGSPEANEATGDIMKVNTLFPSKTEDGETKGGIVILKLRKTGSDESLKLTTSYEDRSGVVSESKLEMNLPSVTSDYYDNNGIRKGILLARYVNVMRNWIDDERESYEQNKPVVPVMTYRTGIVIPPEIEMPMLNKWERQSIPLHVSDEYKSMISDFKNYFESEMQAIGDTTLSQEIEIMEKLI